MPPRILFTCGREPTYPRNVQLISGFEQFYNVTTITDTSKSYIARYLKIISKCLFLSWNHFDLIVVGFLGQPLVPFIRFFTRKPILLDAFISLYDTLCFDRKVCSPESVMGRFVFWLDKISCQLANHIIVDTHAQKLYFRDKFGIPEDKISVLWVGCDDEVFAPDITKTRTGEASSNSLVLFYGSYLPLHGVDVIVRAAKILEPLSNIHFRIIGEGMQKKQISNLARDLGVRNIEFISSVKYETLPDEIGRAKICLGGHFGGNEKAARVIPAKVFQCIAMGKATIVGDNLANAEFLTHGKDAYYCKMNDPEALANAIQFLDEHNDLQKNLEINSRRSYLEKASCNILNNQIKEIAALSFSHTPDINGK
jgi:glycosyltransferase involved in cell wall biosynthesis